MNIKKMKQLFTLIELIVVIVVIGILAAIVVPNISSWQKEAETTAVISNVRNLQTTVDMYATENTGELPGFTTPTVLHPSPIDYDKVHPKHLRNLPKTPGIKYWVDFTGRVWASSIDSPIISLKEDSSNTNKVIVEWESIEGAERYNIYKLENYKGNEGMITGSLSNSQVELTQIDSMSSNSYAEAQKGVAYLVSSVDEQGFESPPSGLGYLGYQDSFVENPDTPNVPDKPTSFSDELLGKTISLPPDSLRTELNLLVDESGTTYAFFLKQNDLIIYTIDANGNLSEEKKITNQAQERNRLQVKLVGEHFYASVMGINNYPRVHKIQKDGTLVSTNSFGGANIIKFGMTVNPATSGMYTINDQHYSSSTNEVVLSGNGTSKKIDSTGYNYSYGFNIVVDNENNVFTLHGRQANDVSNYRIVFGQYKNDLTAVKSSYISAAPNEIQTTDTLVDKNNNVYFLTSTTTTTNVYKVSNGTDAKVVAGYNTSKASIMPTEDGVGFYLIAVEKLFNSNQIAVFKYDGTTFARNMTTTQILSFVDADTDPKGNIVTSRYSDGREITFIKKGSN